MTSLRVGRALQRRLDRLEPSLQPVGCATCRGWTGVVLEGEHGAHRPEQCADCGRVVASTTVVQVVGVAMADL